MAMHTVFTAEGAELQEDPVPVRTIDGKSSW
jgi:hypothetical protein